MQALEPIWQVLHREVLIDTPWLGVESQRCLLPNGKTIEPFYVVHQPSWVLVMAQSEQGEWILGRQYRHGMGRWFLEFPAGIIDAQESPLAAGQRELREETGFGGGEWRYLQSFPVNPDRQNAQFHIVLARGVHLVGDTQWDDAELIHQQRYSTTALDQLVREGGMEHPHHILAWTLNRALFEH